ncbi:Aspartate--tRNA(Asp) ligase [Candidatus Tiddalikarchaeum anstoanum]|nr:Aspartate--tRNA(Asp) ligase [Candidatus Tiddalikarchaeum anstoanum]
MNRVLIKDLKTGEKQVIYGFVQEVRELSSIIFLVIRDVSGILQTVVKKDNKILFDLAKKINKESVVSVSGIVNASKQAPGGKELVIENLEIISRAETPLPIPVIEKGEVTTALDKRFDWRFLDLRKEKNTLMFKVSTAVEKGMRNYWNTNGYIEIHTPKIIGTASESGAEVFMLPYFGREAFLAQSPQFYKQEAMAAGFEKVFEIGTVFRAENSHTTRHLTEIVMIDMEISYIKDHFSVMDEEEAMLKHMLKIVKEEYGSEIKRVFNIDINIPAKFPRISFAEANEIIKKMKGEVEENDLTSAGEKMLGEWAKKEHGSDFLFVYNYPWAKKPFYHMKDDKTPNTTKSFDLLYKGLEITSGSQREHKYEILIKQVKEKKLSEEPLKDYLNAFRYGIPPHGGLGIGHARVVQQMLGLENVREATYIPRDTERITP